MAKGQPRPEEQRQEKRREQSCDGNSEEDEAVLSNRGNAFTQKTAGRRRERKKNKKSRTYGEALQLMPSDVAGSGSQRGLVFISSIAEQALPLFIQRRW